MTQKRKLRYLVMFLCLGMIGFNAFGQDKQAPRVATPALSMEAESMLNTQKEPQTLEEKRALKAAQLQEETRKEEAKVAVAKVADEQSSAAEKAPELTREEVILKLTAEMNANLKNPNYDMKASVEKLRNSSYVIYTLDHYDPSFPLVFATGDAAQDRQNYNEAKAAWKAAQK